MSKLKTKDLSKVDFGSNALFNDEIHASMYNFPDRIKNYSSVGATNKTHTFSRKDKTSWIRNSAKRTAFA